MKKGGHHHILKDYHVPQGLKIVPRRHIRLSASVELSALRPSSCGLGVERMKILRPPRPPTNPFDDQPRPLPPPRILVQTLPPSSVEDGEEQPHPLTTTHTTTTRGILRGRSLPLGQQLQPRREVVQWEESTSSLSFLSDGPSARVRRTEKTLSLLPHPPTTTTTNTTTTTTTTVLFLGRRVEEETTTTGRTTSSLFYIWRKAPPGARSEGEEEEEGTTPPHCHGERWMFTPTSERHRLTGRGLRSCIDVHREDPPTGGGVAQVLEVRGEGAVEGNVGWNAEPLQDFDHHKDLETKTLLELLEHFCGPTPTHPLIPPERRPSPFPDLQADPAYPHPANYPKGPTSRCSVLLESPDSEYAGRWGRESLPGPSHRPPTPPWKKHFLYRYNRASVLPVPSHHKPGLVRKYNATKLPPPLSDPFYQQHRQNIAISVLQQKQIFEAFREESVALGNGYYLEWERRELEREREAWDQYKWDLHTLRYFNKVKAFNRGHRGNRPLPILLINDSVTSLLRRPADTPPKDYPFDPYDDVTVYPGPPLPRRPFIYQHNRPWLRALRGAESPAYVPGGFFHSLWDVRETGSVYRVEEVEFGEFPDYPPPLIDIPSATDTPEQQGVMSPLFTQTIPPHQFVKIFNRDTNFSASIWPSSDSDLTSFVSGGLLGWSRSFTDGFLIEGGRHPWGACYPSLRAPHPQRIREAAREAREPRTLPFGPPLEEGEEPLELLDPLEEEEALRLEALAAEEREAVWMAPYKGAGHGRAPRKVNPYKGLLNRRDWFYWFVHRKQVLTWLYIIQMGMEESEENYDAVEMNFYQVLAQWYGWGPPMPIPPAPRKALIAVVQMSCTEDKEDNLASAEGFFKQAGERGVAMIFFPEAFDYIGETKERTVALAEDLEGLTIQRYRELAAQHNVWVSLGGFHLKMEEEEGEEGPWVGNVHLLLNGEGGVVASYQKIHLFDVDIPEKDLFLHESSYVKAGDKMVLAKDTPLGNIGLGICYDVRFPEFSMALRGAGADVLTFPSAFTYHTGQAHWEALLRARAIENQAYVVAAAQAGQHNERRMSYGSSMIVDPWGTILARAEGPNPGIIFGEVDLSYVDKIRREMPVENHKNPGIIVSLQNLQKGGDFSNVSTPMLSLQNVGGKGADNFSTRSLGPTSAPSQVEGTLSTPLLSLQNVRGKDNDDLSTRSLGPTTAPSTSPSTPVLSLQNVRGKDKEDLSTRSLGPTTAPSTSTPLLSLQNVREKDEEDLSTKNLGPTAAPSQVEGTLSTPLLSLQNVRGKDNEDMSTRSLGPTTAPSTSPSTPLLSLHNVREKGNEDLSTKNLGPTAAPSQVEGTLSTPLLSLQNVRGKDNEDLSARSLGPTAAPSTSTSTPTSPYMVIPDGVDGETPFMFGPHEGKYRYVFLENEGARAMTNRKCVAPGHVLVVSKRVVARLKGLTPHEAAHLFSLAQRVEEVMESKHGTEASTLTLQDGAAAGQTVQHVHIHVIPRTDGDFLDNDSIYRKLATHDKGPNVQWRPYEEMAAEAAEIRAHIRTHFPHFLAPQPEEEEEDKP